MKTQKKTDNISCFSGVHKVLYGPWSGEKIGANCYRLSGRETTAYLSAKFCSQKLNWTASIGQNLESENQGTENVGEIVNVQN